METSLLKEDPKHVTLRFSVRDTGIGISEENIERLFKSFHQADTSTTRRYGGSGLGLTISKQLVEMMGGEIGVESIEGKGSTFWFSISFETQTGSKEETFELPEGIQEKRILLVDDNIANIKILCGYLEAWGCTYDSAESGTMAMKLLHAVARVGASYDMIITDMQMPEMDGAEVGETIKKDPLLKDMKMVMLTSRGLRGDAEAMKKIGFDAYLLKPIRRSQLYDCLVTVFGRELDKKENGPAPLITRHSLKEQRRQSLKILVAEDNTINRKLVLHLLQKFGYEAHSVDNGLEAVQALEQAHYDIVLMDVQMPEMDGLQATQMIRDRKSKVLNRDIPIIALTAYAMAGDRDMCIEKGMDDYLTKPISPAGLSQMIEKYAKKALEKAL
jgi:CheY-like chemotaxis protein